MTTKHNPLDILNRTSFGLLALLSFFLLHSSLAAATPRLKESPQVHVDQTTHHNTPKSPLRQIARTQVTQLMPHGLVLSTRNGFKRASTRKLTDGAWDTTLNGVVITTFLATTALSLSNMHPQAVETIASLISLSVVLTAAVGRRPSNTESNDLPLPTEAANDHNYHDQASNF